MTDSEFVESVRKANNTALSRLGSSKSLYADTMGEMDVEEVLRAAATAEHHAAETYETWAETTTDDDVADAFAETADEEREHYNTVVGELDAHDPGEVPAIQSYLRGLDDDIERLGGFVGRTLAAEKSKEQMTGFFVGKADPQTASLFRGMGDDLDAQLERAISLLEAHCGDDEDCWDRAEEAASGAIQTAYEEYTKRLESMGVNPKPVC
ncbi:rubrerythrin family protein [Natronomonas sp. CBA1123]|uniref:ferritin family protein n=1 Tax=Natronomonas sp. CBA1123 TaxID=2668070 RepID=UPI0012E9AA7E|nr:ferritin family protein [Natronomonas sp. CBA1123]MUV86391.1 rubrerythrin family protein [Natronomonas sp. CBA1123]